MEISPMLEEQRAQVQEKPHAALRCVCLSS